VQCLIFPTGKGRNRALATKRAGVGGRLGNGHTVLALARSDASAQAASAAGAEPIRGGLAAPSATTRGPRPSEPVHWAVMNRNTSALVTSAL
jgi:hypothetical protein